MMSTKTQTGMIAASLAILVYIAILVTGSSLIPQQDGGLLSSQQQGNQTIISQQAAIDSALYDQVSSGLDYVYNATTEASSVAVLLGGQSLNQDQFMLLFDSTPYASKGHVAMVLPCDPADPGSPLFEVLVGRVPEIVPLRLGYIPQVSAPPDMCVYHAQFGFGDPVTDIILKNIANGTVSFEGPHTVAITAHESYIPTTPSPFTLQHQQGQLQVRASGE